MMSAETLEHSTLETTGQRLPTEVMPSWIPRWLLQGRLAIVLSLLFLLLGLGLTAARTYKRYAPVSDTLDLAASGMSDFHNGIYLPSLAFRNGVNPYSLEASDRYQMARAAPPYSPVVFILHLPLTWLSVARADIVFFALNISLLALIARFAITMAGLQFELVPWLWIFGAIVFSRPGHITLFTGYFTAQLVIGTLLAVHFARTRPMLSAVGMMLASAKPTYIIPLTLLMLARRDFKAVWFGMVLCVVGGAAGVGWLASHSSLGEVIEGIKAGQAAFDNDTAEFPVNIWTRVDLAGIASKWMSWKPSNLGYLAVMLLLLIMPIATLWRMTKRHHNEPLATKSNWKNSVGATSVSGMIICLSLLVTLYHHSYDCLLVAVPWIGLLLFGRFTVPQWSQASRLFGAVLLTVPAVNYAATLRFRELVQVDNQSLVWLTITAANGLSLALLLALLLVSAWQRPLLKKPKSAER